VFFEADSDNESVGNSTKRRGSVIQETGSPKRRSLDLA
jgi:hypothetical protein